MNDESQRVYYECLVSAIVKQAAEDYKHAIKFMYKHFGKIILEAKDCYDPDIPVQYYCRYSAITRMRGFQNAQKDIFECEYFFDNCVLTNKFEPGEITDFLRREAIDELRNPKKLKNKSRRGRGYNYFMEDLMCEKDSYV